LPICTRKLVELADEFQFKVGKPVEDEEHHTWSVCYTDTQGATRCIDWTLASSPEFRQMMAKYSLIKEFLEPPFLVEYAAKFAAARRLTRGREQKAA
jgi:DNA gyrase subunit B